MIKVGFIGTGWTDIGQIKAFKKSGLIPQAIFSRDYNKAEKISNKYNIPEIYTNWKKLIESPTVDIVSIVVPTWLHSEIIKYTRKFEKHFICEAPFSSTKEIQTLAENNIYTKLEIIDYELRFTPHFLKMKELLSKNNIGKITSFDFKYKNNFAKDSELNWDWSNDIELGGGHLNLVGGHFIDLSIWLFGKYKRTIKSEFDFSCKTRKDKKGLDRKLTADDYALLEIEFEDDSTGKILVSQMSNVENELSFIVYGTEGILKVENDNLLINNEKMNEFKIIDLNDNNNLFEGFDNNLFTIGSFYLGKEIKKYLEGKKYIKPPTLIDALKNQIIISNAYKTLPNNV